MVGKMSNSSNEGSDNSAVVLWVVIGCVGAFVLLCWIPACRRMQRRPNAPNGSQTSQVAPAAVNGGSAQKDRDLTIDVTEPAVAVIDIAAETAGAGCGGGCCCAGGGCGDGGGCGGCGGGD